MVKQIPLQFKRMRFIDEFNKVDPRIQAITLMLAHQAKELWGYIITVTCIFRSSKEQDYYYRKGMTKIKSSPHMYWRAIDIRMNDLAPDARQELCDLVNENFPRTDNLKTALLHGVGSNIHLHLQVKA